MNLRAWQAACVDAALSKYRKGQRHFLCQATPGAGKTIMASCLAKSLLDSNDVDLVLCFSPSRAVSEGIRLTFSRVLACEFDGGMGALGASFTYQRLQHIPERFWNALAKYRVLAIFDEVHHCSGDDASNANTWGEKILANIQQQARYTLALTGTPWRTDLLPIVMAEYSDPEGEIVCDYRYDLKRAVAEKVCRAPNIVLVDNDQLTVSQNGTQEQFTSLNSMLSGSQLGYRCVLNNHGVVSHLLKLGCRKLSEIRKTNPTAGGLVVASSVKHASEIATLLKTDLKQSVVVVTYRDEYPQCAIDRFRSSETQWIVSVGMISEGTDIPRLQVCCYLSSVATELYFRQVLGRILRISEGSNQEAWLFTLAEARLTAFAESVEQDIPESCRVIKLSNNQLRIASLGMIETEANGGSSELSADNIDWPATSSDDRSSSGNLHTDRALELLKYGQFKERVIAAFSCGSR